MNSYERVMAALQRSEPDRVPILEFVIDRTVLDNVRSILARKGKTKEDIGLDGVCCSVVFNVDSVGHSAKHVDDWGIVYKTISSGIRYPVKGPIQSTDDLTRYYPPDADVQYRLGELQELVKRFKHKKAIVFLQQATFTWSAHLNGFSNLLQNFLANEELVKGIMDIVINTNIKIARNAVRAGADVILLNDDYAGKYGPLFSPELFKKFIYPRLKKIVDAIHDEGGMVIKHADGNIWPLIEMMIDTGIDAINPIEPVAGMDIREVKERYGALVCLIGNIDCTHLLSTGSTNEVRRAVRNCIHDASCGGGYIISSSNSIHSGVKADNWLAMIEESKKYGHYRF